MGWEEEDVEATCTEVETVEPLVGEDTETEAAAKPVSANTLIAQMRERIYCLREIPHLAIRGKRIPGSQAAG